MNETFAFPKRTKEMSGIMTKVRLRLLQFVVIFVLVMLNGFSLYASSIEGLVGHWTFNDGSGKDISGNGNDAILGGAESYVLDAGQACLKFVPNTESTCIPVSEESPLAISQGTICFWLNLAWADSPDILRFNNDAVRLRLYRRHLTPYFKGEDGFIYGSGVIDYNWPKYDMREWAFYPHERANVGDAEWHFFAVAYDYEQKRIIGWRDNQLIAVVDLSEVNMQPLLQEDLTEIVIGNKLAGFVDDIQIYNRVLNDIDVRQRYNAGRSVYDGRSDTITTDKKLSRYRYKEEDRTLYQAWLQYNPQPERLAKELLGSIVAEGSNSTILTAASELTDAVESMFSLKSAVKTKPVSGPQVVLGTAETSSWIRDHVDELGLDRIKKDGFVCKAIYDGNDTTLVIAGRVPAGVIFGTFDLIRRIQMGQDPCKLDVLENPQVPIRMVNHWTFFGGFKYDNWTGGNSIFSWDDLRTGDTKLLRDWVRMMACAGWNAICPTNVNWNYRNNFLEHLDEVETLAEILRDYGMKLYWSPSYLLALEKETADKLYSRVPDFGGYMMKLGSEKQNGDPRPPMVNRIADNLKPYGGMCLVRGFVYGNKRYTPEPYRDLLPYDIFAPEDGNYRDNVILVPKSSAGDWDFSAPIPAFDGAMKKTLLGAELVIEERFPSFWFEKWKWWLEQDNYRNGPGSLNKFDMDCIMGVALNRPSPSWANCPLNMVNYYGLGRLAWNPDLSVDAIYAEWIRMTFGDNPKVLNTIKTILNMSDDTIRKLYKWRGYRGVWLDTGDDGLVEDKTPYVINKKGIGPISPNLQKRILDQYAPGLRKVYGGPLRSEEFLPSFHFKNLDYRLSIGRTLIEDIYGNLDEAVEMARQMVELWKGLEGKVDQRRFKYTLDILVDFIDEARDNRESMAAAFEKHTGRKYEKVVAGLSASNLASVGTFNVRHFGAVADGTTNDAPSINNAIDACNAAGGGTVFVPSGIYATGSIQIKSNVTLVLDAGAELKAKAGWMDPWEPNKHDKGLMDPAYYHWEASLIWGKNLENVKIYGPGTLDGSELTKSSNVPKGIGDKGIALKLCKNVEIRNLNIREGGHYAILATGCDGMLIDNVTIKTNRDGLNLSQCSNVEVANCHIDAVRYEDGHPAGGDDAIKFGSDLSLGKALPSENITVRNCYLASGCNTLQFGSETIGTFKNIRFENIRINRAGKAGICITSNDGSNIENIHYKDIKMEKTFAPIFIKVLDVARVPKGFYKRGSIKNITFENVTAADCFSYFRGREMPSVIWGKPNSPIENIKFKNVSITAKGGHPVSDAEIQPVENDERFPRHVGTIPAYAWYLRHVKNVTFVGCEFPFEKADGRPAIVIDDAEDVTFDNTTLPIGSENSSRIVVRNQTNNLILNNCKGMGDRILSTKNSFY
jgi:alpha-glucuronidase/polygalacturonase